MSDLPVPPPALATILALAVLGCDPPGPGECSLPESLVGPDLPIIPVGEVDFEPSDASAGTWVEIARKAPSFAGFYLDHGLVVQVADPADAPAVVEAVRSSRDDRRIRTKLVRYSYLQLARWEHAAIVNLANLGLTRGGVVVIGNGVDEVQNEVKIEVRQNTCTSEIARILTGGAPQGGARPAPSPMRRRRCYRDFSRAG